MDGSNELSSNLKRRIHETEESNRQLREQMDELIHLVHSQHSSIMGTSHASGAGVGGASNEQVRADLTSDPVAQPSSATNVFTTSPPLRSKKIWLQ
uniref:Uncharacterized protein n=1 Tax=Cannabis sativa TaxID=3483 RepID=A0A803PM27_CANSA